jgi:hypothetical protein
LHLLQGRSNLNRMFIVSRCFHCLRTRPKNFYFAGIGQVQHVHVNE